MCVQLNRLDLKVSEMRRIFRTVAHDDELDLGHDEAIATSVTSHQAVQMRQATQIFNLAVVALDPHAGVPSIE
jgi:hypothetical protein